MTPKNDESKFHVVLPATAGAKGNLCVGKRGVFFDIQGREYDARITQIVENPISIREALAAPFVRLWHFVIGKIEAMSGASEKELQKSADALLKAPPADAAGSPTAGLPGGPTGLLVGLSVSAAAIGSAFAFITKTLTALSRAQAVLGLLGGALVVGIPVTLIAMLKLRRQDLSSLLEGCGWAINARMRFDRAQRRQFTRRPPYPAHATGIPSQHRLKKLVAGLIVAALATLIYYILRSMQNGH